MPQSPGGLACVFFIFALCLIPSDDKKPTLSCLFLVLQKYRNLSLKKTASCSLNHQFLF